MKSKTASVVLQNTSFTPGRPRIGELRLVNANAASVQKWREKNREHYREYQRIKQAEWRANNLERRREIARESMKRRAERQKNQLILVDSK